MDNTKLNARVNNLLIVLMDSHGELSDGAILDAIYEIVSSDDLDNDEKIYCINEIKN